ncbi:MAG: SIR2 family NAD-dependent protein deacylase [Anaerolineae bacterium]
MNDEKTRHVAQKLRDASVVTVLTGAGVSKESGVPTFRDALEGLWAQYDPAQLATPQAFRANPKLVWDWYEWRRALLAKVVPNPGHYALAQLADYVSRLHLITQNVDDLHEQAGSASVIHLHGNIATHKCFDDCQGVSTLIDLSTLAYDSEAGPPTCPHCGAYVRPNVVWFGESLPSEALSDAVDYANACDVMLVVGTSGMVSPASELPRVAKQRGAFIIEINPDNSAITPLADLKCEGASGVVLPQILEALRDA